jgi:hypothetical protein
MANHDRALVLAGELVETMMADATPAAGSQSAKTAASESAVKSRCR